MAEDWDKLLADLEGATRRLAAAEAEDPTCAEALGARLEAIGRLQAALATGPPPAQTRARLEQIHALGQTAVVRMIARRDSLRTSCDGLHREAQWLRQMRPFGGGPAHSVDCSG